MIIPNHDKQSGHAALLFVLLFPFLFGIFALGTDGARALQDKARLEEASEIAALTVAAQNSDSKDEREATAKKIIQEYFPQSNITDVNVDKLACENNNNCNQNNSDQQRFFEYRVSVTLSEDSWFYSEDTSDATSMGESYNVAGYSTARKYQSEAVDVVLVADYSGSMDDTWSNGQKKYISLNNIIIEVAEELQKYNELNTKQKNKLALVGFNVYTSKYEEGKKLFAHHLKCIDNHSCTPKNPPLIYYRNRYYYNVDFQKTVDNIFNVDTTEWLNKNNVSDNSVFQTLALTDDFDGLTSSIKNMFSVSGGTASYSGLIRGAQIAKEGSNPRSIIIILSDGLDNYPYITDELIKKGLCSKILKTLNNEKTSDGKEVKARLAAVGFDYDIQNNPQMKNCVGADNVYKAENTDDIKNKILELISEEIGHLAL